jgi:hypothetical protein
MELALGAAFENMNLLAMYIDSQFHPALEPLFFSARFIIR